MANSDFRDNSVTPDRTMRNISFDFKDFYDEKILDRFVKSVERMVRSDRSYLNYVAQIKDIEVNLSKDVVLQNLNVGDVSIEMHHHPLTLYDIVLIIMLHKFNNDQDFNSFSLAKEVIKLHYDNLIGLAPMSVTTHELAHIKIDEKTNRRYINLTKKQIFGKYEEFIELYKDGLTLETRQKIEDFNAISEDQTFKIDQKDLFK